MTYKKALTIVLDYVERHNKQDEDKLVAEAANLLFKKTFGHEHEEGFWCDECQTLATKPSELSCGNGCGFVAPYGFVPEAGCPIHDY